MKNTLLALFILTASACFGQSAFYQLPVPLPNAVVRVCPIQTANPCPAPVSIFSDSALSQGISNPFPVGVTGNFGFYVASGQYVIQIPSPYNLVYTISLGGGGALSTFATLAGGTNTTSAMNVGSTPGTSAATLVPSGTGQLSASGLLIGPGGPDNLFAPQAVLTIQTSGGTFNSGQSVGVEIVINQGSAHSYPSFLAVQNTSSGGCVSNCTVTVTAPTLTGAQTYTVYSYYSAISSTLLQQTASANCVAITINCVIGTAGVGAAVPTSNTAAVLPSPLIDGCPPDVDPAGFVQTTDGNWRSAIGLDRTSASGTTGSPYFGLRGFLEFCTPVIFNISGVQPNSSGAGPGTVGMQGNGSILVMNQLSPGNVFGVQIQTQTVLGESRTFPGQLQSLYAEQDIFGTPTLQGGEANAGALRGTTQIVGNAHLGGGQLAEVVGVSGFSERQLNANPNQSAKFAGIVGLATNQGGAGNGWFFEGGTFLANDSSPHDGTSSGYGISVLAPTAGAFFTGSYNVGVNIGNFSNTANSCPVGTSCFDILASGSNGDPTQGQNYFSGLTYLPGFKTTATTMTVLGSESMTGSFGAAQLATPEAPQVSPTNCAGAATWSYVLVGKDGNSSTTAAGATASTGGTSCATLDGTHFLTVCTNSTQNWTTTGTSSYDVYRTVVGTSPNTTGKIGTLTPTFLYQKNNICLTDNGLAGDGTTAATANTTGGLDSAGIVKATTGTGNTVFVTSDFNSAANTSLQTITGLSFQLPGTAGNYSFHCSILYSLATSAVPMQFGIQSATVAPTQINAKGRVDTGFPSTFVGILTGLTTTTATSIVTFTPSAITTVFDADIDGLIEEPVSTGNTINIMVQTSNSADLPKVKRGSFCSLLP